ncbi:hypothetical protein [Sphingobacterium zeae]|uniref:hypothetical protein n=1 Tax=Sphingobacterium zeae TaxID=1776859 RepID=UPI003623D4C4
MDKLTLEHLAPYLPYGLKVETPKGLHTLKGIDTVFDAIGLCYWLDGNKEVSFSIDCKPVLRPLSDLIKVIEYDGRKFIPMHRLKDGGTYLNEFRFLEWKGYSAIDNEEHETCYDPETMSFNQFYRGDSRMCTKQYEKMQLLFKWHFDVFGLIEKGLAIDINSIEGKETKGNG